VEEEQIRTNRPILMSNPKGINAVQKQQKYWKKNTTNISKSTRPASKNTNIGCAMTTPDQKFRKRLKPQNAVYSAEQKAIIKADKSTASDHNGVT
jgi:hypothetical protein